MESYLLYKQGISKEDSTLYTFASVAADEKILIKMHLFFCAEFAYRSMHDMKVSHCSYVNEIPDSGR